MGMRMQNVQMTSTVNRLDLLKTIKENAAKHAAIVQEAREGYVRQARKALESRLQDILQGKVVALTFNLTPPQDYSETYATVISMLEWNKEAMVELEADEFRQLVLDRWDWTHGFYADTSSYSKTSRDWLKEATGGAFVAPPTDDMGSGAPSER